ncbi:MAG: YqgE/AlgH family protein [Pseudomonadota bacterium]
MQKYPNLKNHFLLASPYMADPRFTRALILVCEHSAEGSMGIVLNKFANLTLADVGASLKIPVLEDRKSIAVLKGGPVHMDRGFIIHDAGPQWSSTHEVAPGLYVTTTREILLEIGAGGGPERFLIALGCVGWDEGQLEQELNSVDWIIHPADNKIIFNSENNDRLQLAASQMGVDLVRFAPIVGHA